jgi:hypothetical protein
MTVRCLESNGRFRVGQQGEFELLDASYRPYLTVAGTIVKLMAGEDALYALIETETGVRPARLSRSVIRQ